MKTLCLKFAFINLLFVTNIYSKEIKLKYPRLKRDQPWLWSGDKLNTKNIIEPNIRPKPIVIYPELQTPNFKKDGRRISETKCLEYIWERNNREQTQYEAFRDFARSIYVMQNKFLDSEGNMGCAEIGGRDALETEFPHMGALGWKSAEGTWIFKCGSSLISSKFSLTAAHCSKIPLDGTIVNQVPEIVRLGENIIKDVIATSIYSIDANILRIIVHPQYSPPKKYYDIALIEFVSELHFSSNVQPVCLWNSFNMSRLGTKVTSTGWGVVNTTTRMTAATLQAIEIDIIDSNFCGGLLNHACGRHWCGLQEHQLCAGKLAGGVDACQGDSGGPLQVKINLHRSEQGTMHYLIGVTSFGIGCARPNLPGVYTRVSSFVDWIESIVWPEQ